MVVCIVVMLVLVFMFHHESMVSGFVLMYVVYLVLLIVACFLSLGVGLCIVNLCSGGDGCYVLSDLGCL